METADSHPSASLPPGLDNPTDRLICGLLAAEPMPSPEIAARLAIPPRTARHRLMRLRDAGTVAVGDDGFYRLVDLAAAALSAVAGPSSGLAADSTTPATGENAAEWVAVGVLAACCVVAAIWAASRAAPEQSQAPAAPATSSAWSRGMRWPGPCLW